MIHLQTIFSINHYLLYVIYLFIFWCKKKNVIKYTEFTRKASKKFDQKFKNLKKFGLLNHEKKKRSRWRSCGSRMFGISAKKLTSKQLINWSFWLQSQLWCLRPGFSTVKNKTTLVFAKWKKSFFLTYYACMISINIHRLPNHWYNIKGKASKAPIDQRALQPQVMLHFENVLPITSWLY